MTLAKMVHHTLPISTTTTKDGSGVCDEIIKESLYPILGQRVDEAEFEQKQQQQQQQQQYNNINNNNNNNYNNNNNNNSNDNKEFKSQEVSQQDLYKISKKDKSEDLKNRYTSTKRNQEIISVTLFAVFLGISIYRLVTWYFVKNIWILLSSSVLAMFAADFFSGIVHWAADTWGSLDTPLVGNSFIRSFREHHVAPVAMTKHDVIETNGDNCMLTVPILAFTAFAKIQTDTAYDMFIFSFLVNLCFWVSLTNQIHKWSHTYNVHPIVGFLQRNGIILSKKDHAIHHRNPFDKFYCITNGWLNPWLASIGFWKRLENVITLLTGAIPRADDQAWTS